MSNFPRIGVGVFIMKNGKFLMGKRVGSHGSNTWSVPGGYLEFRETLQDCGKREVMEETGLSISEPEIIAVTNNIFADEDKHTITIWLKSDWVKGKPKITEPDKFIDQDWFTLETLPSPLFMPCVELLKQGIVL